MSPPSRKSSPSKKRSGEPPRESGFVLDDLVMFARTLLPMACVVGVLLLLPVMLGEERGGAILGNALSRAFRGGVPGFAAAVVQIMSLMWLRTTINYQYKTGKSLSDALQKLWAEGGVRRFYRGFGPAIVLVPLSRFGDTAANAGVLALLKGSTVIPVAVQTAAASGASSLWRIVLMPLMVLKTTLQVGGARAMPDLRKRVQRLGGTAVFFKGTEAVVLAQFMGHYPWFVTHNSLEIWVPDASPSSPGLALARAAAIGCICSIVSDCITNCIKVVNTYRQTSAEELTYAETIRRVVDEGGLIALFTRGLGAKMIVNCLNSIIFKVLLKLWH